MLQRGEVARLACLFLLSATIAHGPAADGVARGEQKLRILEQRLIGDDLRLLVETFDVRAHVSGDATQENRGVWLLSVDMSSNNPDQRRTRVFGPLVSDPRVSRRVAIGEPTSWMSAIGRKGIVGSGVIVVLGMDGKTLRYRNGRSSKVIVCDELVKNDDAFQWIARNSFRAESIVLHPDPEKWVCTGSGRYVITRRGNDVVMFDTELGVAIQDDWMLKAFRDYLSMPDLGNSNMWLSDDLSRLLCRPHSAWRRNDGVRVEPFRIGDKVYDRSRFAVLWQRPNVSCTAIEKVMGDDVEVMQWVYFLKDGAITLNLLQEKLRLATLTGETAFEIARPTDADWKFVAPRDSALLSDSMRLAFLVRRFESENGDLCRESVIFSWDLRGGTIAKRVFDPARYFQRRGDKLVPIELTPIAQSD